MTHSSTPPVWSADLLSRFGAADEIEISTRRRDGSPRPFMPIWIVAVGEALYVRSYRGAGVTVTPLDTQRREDTKAIDDAYRSKYGRYGDTYLQPMLADQAVAATLQLTPQH
jgi:hypothetical protein